MESKSAYNNKSRYMAEYCEYNRTTRKATRPVVIDWKKSISNIISLSQLEKGINIDIQSAVKMSKKKKSTRKKSKSDNKSNIEITKVYINDDESESEDHNMRILSFWDMLSGIRWFDKDERRMISNDLIQNVNMDQLRYIFEQIDETFIPELRTALNDVPLLQAIDDENHNNILTHIILKGKQFYEGIIQNPEVSLYLIPQYYPAYDWAMSIIRR